MIWLKAEFRCKAEPNVEGGVLIIVHVFLVLEFSTRFKSRLKVRCSYPLRRNSPGSAVRHPIGADH